MEELEEPFESSQRHSGLLEVYLKKRHEKYMLFSGYKNQELGFLAKAGGSALVVVVFAVPEPLLSERCHSVHF